jgi:hypothetical protein
LLDNIIKAMVTSKTIGVILWPRSMSLTSDSHQCFFLPKL